MTMVVSLSDSNVVKNITQAWVEKFIIGENICPFAKRPWEAGKWEIVDFQERDFEKLLTTCETYIKEFNKKNLDTSLIVTSAYKGDFYDYLDLTSMLEGALKNFGLQDEMQLVAFHPEFCFEGEQMDSRANFVNRSPYPLIHLLRSAEMNRIVDKHGVAIGEEISLANGEFLNSLSEEEFQRRVLDLLILE